jgi:hypothetical protein
MVLNLTCRTLVEANRLEGNQSGLWVIFGEDNVIRSNRISDNSEYGILVDNWRMTLMLLPPGATRNLFVRNTMTGNRVNAFDRSGYTPSLEEVEALIDLTPMTHEQLETLQSDPGYRRQLAQEGLSRYQPGANRWDDGALGNHCDDFDEAAEGFRDADGDGVGEAAHPIPGGGMVDRFPLTEARALAG